MALTLTPTNQITKLDVKVWKEKINQYLLFRLGKKNAEAQAREYEKGIKSLRSALREAMNGAPVAHCGHAVLTFITKDDVPGALTLINGEKIPLSAVTSVLVGNRTVNASEIQTWYGGRQGSEDLQVEGAL